MRCDQEFCHSLNLAITLDYTKKNSAIVGKLTNNDGLDIPKLLQQYGTAKRRFIPTTK